MSEVTAYVLVDYRIKALRKFTERLYAESKAEGMNLEWAGYSTDRVGDAENSFVSGDKLVYFDGNKYDELMEKLGIRNLGSFKILMINKEEKIEDSKIYILYCVPDAVLSHRLMQKASSAISKGKVIKTPFIKRKKWDFVDITADIELMNLIGEFVELILNILSMM